MPKHALVCSMGASEHIAKWQQLFTATLSKSDAFASIIFLLLTFVFLAVFARAQNISPLTLALYPPIPKNKPETKLFNHLVIAFLQGILNPKIYSGNFYLKKRILVVKGGILEFSYTFAEIGLHEIFFDFAFVSNPETIYEAPDFLIDIQKQENPASIQNIWIIGFGTAIMGLIIGLFLNKINLR